MKIRPLMTDEEPAFGDLAWEYEPLFLMRRDFPRDGAFYWIFESDLPYHDRTVVYRIEWEHQAADERANNESQ